MNWKKVLSTKSCRFGSRWDWSPLEGNKRKLEMRRTRIEIRLQKNSNTSFEPCLITLPALYDEGRFLMELVGAEDTGHFEIKSLDGVPFFHNRNYCFHAVVCEGDVFDFDYNRLEIPWSLEEENGEELPIKRWPEHLSIMLEGETGTGKTTMAKKIHDLFHDPNLPFVSINLSAFNPGLIESELFGHDKGAFTGAHKEKRGAFELAGKGTLFIDEVDSLPLGLQVKVLSFLDDKKFRSVGSESSKEARCRVIFASGRKIEALVEEEKFRMDLFFRIGSGLKVKLRPLRSNPDLLISIIRNFEKEQGVSFSKECIQFYLEAKWPGNIRQFKSHLWRKLYSESSSRLVRLSQEDHELGSFTGGIGELEESNILELKHVKREHCRKIYMGSHESIPLAAKRLRIAQTTLRRILTG